MKTRQLGKDGYRIGEVGLGCWQFGGDFGDMQEETAIAIMETAVANGVNFFDTANVYGAGRSEDLIGRFLKTCSSPVTVATKFGRGDDVYPDNYSEDIMRRSVEGSLERLGVDRLDLLQLHCIAPAHSGWPRRETFPGVAITSMKRRPSIDFLGDESADWSLASCETKL